MWFFSFLHNFYGKNVYFLSKILVRFDSWPIDVNSISSQTPATFIRPNIYQNELHINANSFIIFNVIYLFIEFVTLSLCITFIYTDIAWWLLEALSIWHAPFLSLNHTIKLPKNNRIVSIFAVSSHSMNVFVVCTTQIHNPSPITIDQLRNGLIAKLQTRPRYQNNGENRDKQTRWLYLFYLIGEWR